MIWLKSVSKHHTFNSFWLKERIILFFSNGSTSGNGNLDRTPFDEEEWDEEGHIDPLVDNGEPGVKVRALYDYEAAESDELDFKAGIIHNVLFFVFNFKGVFILVPHDDGCTL